MPLKAIDVGKMSKWEKISCFLSISLWFAAWYSFIGESTEFKNALSADPTGPNEFNFSRDNSDYEWDRFVQNMTTNYGIIYLIFAMIIDLISKKICPKLTQPILLSYSVFIYLKIYGIYALLMNFVLSIVFYGLTKFNKKSIIWLSATVLIPLVNAEAFKTQLKQIFINQRNLTVDFFIISFFMLLRILSFTLDKITLTQSKIQKIHKKPKVYENDKKIRNEPKISDYNLVNYLTYTHYPTFMFFSMFVSFKNFIPVLKSQNNLHASIFCPEKLKKVFNLILYMVVSVFFLSLGHYTTSGYTIIAYTDNYLHLFSGTSIAMTLLGKGWGFSSRYVCFYGITAVPHFLMGMQITDLPKPIFLMQTSREMWKFFDTGFYDFIKNYLYIPFGGNKSSVFTQICSVLMSFVFISLWHGYSLRIAAWSAANCLIVLFELFIGSKIGGQIERSNWSLKTKRYYLIAYLSIFNFFTHFFAFFLLTNMDKTVKLWYAGFFGCPQAFIMFIWGYPTLAQMRLEYVDFKP